MESATGAHYDMIGEDSEERGLGSGEKLLWELSSSDGLHPSPQRRAGVSGVFRSFPRHVSLLGSISCGSPVDHFKHALTCRTVTLSPGMS